MAAIFVTGLLVIVFLVYQWYQESDEEVVKKLEVKKEKKEVKSFSPDPEALLQKVNRKSPTDLESVGVKQKSPGKTQSGKPQSEDGQKTNLPQIARYQTVNL